MEIALGSEQGVRQSVHSDACISETLAPNAVLFGVADGFGVEGQERSTALNALELVRDALLDHRAAFRESLVSEESLRAVMLAVLDHANARLYAAGGSHEDFVGSGTSLTAMLIVNRHAVVGHVGDARAYLLRFARLEALTTDDALFAGAQGTAGIAGVLRSSLPAKPRARGLLWRSLGTQPKLEASIAHVDVLAGDQIVLCTGGVHASVSAEEICGALLESERACDATARLLGIMKTRGGLDNGTVITARDLTALESTAPAPRERIGFVGRLLLAAASLLLAVVLLFALCR